MLGPHSIGPRKSRPTVVGNRNAAHTCMIGWQKPGRIKIGGSLDEKYNRQKTDLSATVVTGPLKPLPPSDHKPLTPREIKHLKEWNKGMEDKELRVTKGGFSTTRSSPSFIKVSTDWRRLSQQDERFFETSMKQTFSTCISETPNEDCSLLAEHPTARRLLEVEEVAVQSPRLEGLMRSHRLISFQDRVRIKGLHPAEEFFKSSPAKDVYSAQVLPYTGDFVWIERDSGYKYPLLHSLGKVQREMIRPFKDPGVWNSQGPLMTPRSGQYATSIAALERDLKCKEEVSRLRKEMQETIDYARAKHDEDPERSQLSPRSAEAHSERGGSAAYACAKGYARRRIQEKKQVVIPREGLAQSTENNSSSRVKKTPRTGGRTPRQSRDGEVGKEASQRKARKAAQLLEQPVLSSQAEVRGTAEDGSGGSIAAAVGESQSKTVAGGKEEGIVSTGQKNAEDTAKEQDKKAGGERARI